MPYYPSKTAGLNIRPTPNTLIKGVDVIQTITTADGAGVEGPDSNGYSYNRTLINDALGGTFSGENVYGESVFLETGGLNVEQNRTAGFFQNTLNALTTGSTAARFYAGLGALVFGKASDGGMNTGAGARGSLFGFFAACVQLPAATNFFAHFGGEISTANQGTVAHRVGLALTDLGAVDTVRGATTDCHLSLGSLPGATQKLDGMLVSSLHGQYGLDVAGTIIRSTTATLLNGINLAAVTFTGFAYQSPGYSVDPDGDVLLKSASLPNVQYVRWRNAADTAYVDAITLTSGDALLLAAPNGFLFAGGILPLVDITYSMGSTANRFSTGYFNEVQLGTGIRDLTGAGSPETVITAPVGSTYRRTNGGAGTTFYVKESGVGNTGWVGK